jgi:hypothetical protein
MASMPEGGPSPGTPSFEGGPCQVGWGCAAVDRSRMELAWSCMSDAGQSVTAWLVTHHW